jgi:hypothetical protein
LPNIALYIPHKDLFANLIGTYDTENILFFAERAIIGKVPLNTVKKLTLPDKRCEDIKEKPQENLEDDEILREMIEERKKREQMEKGKDNTKSDKKEKKKKKDKKDKEEL